MTLPVFGPDGYESSPRLVGIRGLSRLPLVLKLLLVLLACGATAGVVFAALTFYPKDTPPTLPEVERQAASVFELPVDTADSRIVGDLLVERFYALDAETGDRYVGDMLKGRIQGLQPLGPAGTERYIALLDLGNLQRDRALYAAYVDAVARPQGDYLGLRVFPGVADAFRLNYDGTIPENRVTVSGPDGDDPYDFLLTQKYNQVTDNGRLIKVQGHNFLLSNTDRFPYFRNEFRTGKALLLSELIIVDATANPQRATFLRLQDQYRTVTPR